MSMNLRGSPAFLLCAISFAGAHATDAKLTPAQQIAVYRRVLADSKGFCRSFSHIRLDNDVSDPVFAKVKALDARISRDVPLSSRRASIFLEPEVVENGRLHVFATVGPPEGPNLELSMFLRKSRIGWQVEKAPVYPLTPEIQAAAFEVVLSGRSKGSVFVDASEAVLNLLRRRHPAIHPITELKRKSSQTDDGEYFEVDASSNAVWQNPRLVRLYLHTMAHQAGADVSAETGGPVRVWRSGHDWKAKKVDFWGGE